jgi:hypothetical protein
MPDENELKQQAAEQRQAFEERRGYPANLVPYVWIGQNVALNMFDGRGENRQLGPIRASGMLEAVSDNGYVISVEDRVVFIPRSAVLQIELHETSESSSGSSSGARLE